MRVKTELLMDINTSLVMLELLRWSRIIKEALYQPPAQLETLCSHYEVGRESLEGGRQQVTDTQGGPGWVLGH